ncbi:hypothetical protein SAK_1344 [Streptococcus agalactiae A909]|nr:hypothetical protein SAK_1344 [Streptococcus agalactiae A909]CCQ76492.1 hypothetical protein GBS1219_1055 [Streptococcus agalactiae SS1219]CCQ78311.1 hypothetical protein GBS90503_1055 [Streptococcus agalactiae LADL-90-503]CCQ82683.1 hypothetical protein GBS1014_1178 [Streptococcus agalactiae SS1014]
MLTRLVKAFIKKTVPNPYLFFFIAGIAHKTQITAKNAVKTPKRLRCIE